MLKVKASNSKIEGRGLFATCDIRKGETAFVMRGKILKCDIRTKRDAMKLPDIVGIGKGKWIDPIPPFKFINHSCNPNLGTKGTVTFVALRNIKKGEEVTFDYSISEDSLWEMKCLCGNSNCRRIIRGIKYLPIENFKKYLPYIPKYFQKVYKKYKKEELVSKKKNLKEIKSFFNIFERIFVD